MRLFVSISGTSGHIPECDLLSLRNSLVSNAGFSQPIAAWDGGPNLGFGNEGRDAIVGPGRTNFTTSVYKSFAFTERAHFEVRIDSFNTFNHTQFNAFNNSAAAGNFGFTTGTQDPREFEFGGKFVF